MNIFINMEMIKLKDLLPEQNLWNPVSETTDLESFKKKYSTEYKIAENILKSRPGYSSLIGNGNPSQASTAILSIKNIQQYTIVDKIFKKMTKGVSVINWIKTSDKLRDPIFRWQTEYTSGDNVVSASENLRLFELVVKHLNKLNVQGVSVLQTELKQMKNWTANNRIDIHKANETAALLSSFIPGVGLYISSGIMLYDAAQYWNEGNYYESGNSVIWASLPFIGPIGRMLGKIPGVKPGITLTSKFFANIGKKVASKAWKTLNPLELKIVKKIVENGKFVKNEFNKFLQRLAKNAPEKLKNVGRKGQAVIRQIAKGSVDLAKLGGKLVGKAAKGLAPVVATQYAWDKLYFDLGLDKALGGDDAYEFGVVDAGLNQTGNQGRYVYK